MAGPEHAEAETKEAVVTEETVAAVVEVATGPTGVPDILQTHQMECVIAITLMETNLGTA